MLMHVQHFTCVSSQSFDAHILLQLVYVHVAQILCLGLLFIQRMFCTSDVHACTIQVVVDLYHMKLILFPTTEKVKN